MITINGNQLQNEHYDDLLSHNINNLPNEIKTEILKYKPSYRSINQSLHKDSGRYYNQHCYLPLTLREIIKQVENFKNFTLFTSTNQSFTVYHIFKRNEVRQWTFGYNKQLYYSFEYYILNNINHLLLNEGELSCDLDLLKLVLKTRHCYNNENVKKILLNEVQFEDEQIKDIKTAYHNIKKSIYYIYNVGGTLNSTLLEIILNLNDLSNEHINLFNEHLYVNTKSIMRLTKS